MSEEVSTSRPISGAFAEPGQLSSRDIFRLLSRAYPFIRPYRRDIGSLFILGLPGALAVLFGLVLVRVFFDVIGNGQPLTPFEAWMLRLPMNSARQTVLTRACLEGGAAALLGAPYFFGVVAYAVWILQKIGNLFRVNLFAQLQELSLTFHAEEKIGDAIFRMFKDTAGIPQIITGLLLRPIGLLPLALANFLWLVFFNYAMALVACLVIAAELVLASMFSAPLRRVFLRAREATALATTRIEETLAAIKAVKAFGREDHEASVYADENWESLLAEREARMLLLVYRVVSNFLRGLAYLVVVYIGARQVITGHSGGFTGSTISLGLFQSTLIAFGRIAGGANGLAMTWGSLQDVGVGFARVFQILRQHSDRAGAMQSVDRGNAAPPSSPRVLSFDHVSFAYVRGVNVLNRAAFEARAGELTAIVGPSGTGKTTIIGLLLRFFDPGSGQILLDGRNIREFDLDSWRQMIAVVLQSSPLLTGTLHDNLAYGRSDASPEEIRKALQRAGIAEFVDSLPCGLLAMVGERGTKLSTGQKQRIGVARAMLRDAPILLLDEPSSALDIATEERLMRGIKAWIAERPTERLAMMMTHRRTAAAWADRLYKVGRNHFIEPVELDSRTPAVDARDV